jgi:hypothetical protein
MSELPILDSAAAKHREELVLVGLRLDPTHEGPQFYTLLAVGGDNERPAIAVGRILFFTRPEQANEVLTRDPTFALLGPPPLEMETFCDVAEALHLVNSQDADPEGVVLECMLVFDDLVRATGIRMPERYQALLTELTARLTEGAQLRAIFRSSALREHVEDALLWCVGAIAAKATLLAE